MSLFSDIRFSQGFLLVPEEHRGLLFQASGLAPHLMEPDFDGRIMSDGLYVRLDGKCIPSLNGFIKLVGGDWPAGLIVYFARFENGYIVEVLPDVEPADWRDISNRERAEAEEIEYLENDYQDLSPEQKSIHSVCCEVNSWPFFPRSGTLLITRHLGLGQYSIAKPIKGRE